MMPNPLTASSYISHLSTVFAEKASKTIHPGSQMHMPCGRQSLPAPSHLGSTFSDVQFILEMEVQSLVICYSSSTAPWSEIDIVVSTMIIGCYLYEDPVLAHEAISCKAVF